MWNVWRQPSPQVYHYVVLNGEAAGESLLNRIVANLSRKRGKA